MSESNTTRLKISASDTVGAIVGEPKIGKSTLCNRLCTTIDYPPDERDVADVYCYTDEPEVYNLKNSRHDKILDLPGYLSEEFPSDDMASFAARNHLHRADYVIIILSHRHKSPAEDIVEWCMDNDKPCVFVQTGIHDYQSLAMREHKCSQSEAITHIRERSYEYYVHEEVPYFMVDTEQWQTAIEAYEAGDYDAAQLHYDEGELLKFVARVGQVKYTPGGSLPALFESHAERQSKDESENCPTQLETALLDVHFISRSRFNSQISADYGVASTQTQTELPPPSSRAVRLSPTFFQ